MSARRGPGTRTAAAGIGLGAGGIVGGVLAGALATVAVLMIAAGSFLLEHCDPSYRDTGIGLGEILVPLMHWLGGVSVTLGIGVGALAAVVVVLAFVPLLVWFAIVVVRARRR
ncbi:MAG: hypothetical protein M3Y87_34345 [Myxococcota bacterium]|nr:hypothetical protein [Myxococcota bacterium]